MTVHPRGSTSHDQEHVGIRATRPPGPRRAAGCDDQDDQGYAVIWTLGLALAMLGLVGLVVDGGALLRTGSNAHSAASAAARVGAQQLDFPNMLDPDGEQRDGEDARIHPIEGPAAAEAYLEARGYPDADAQVTDDGARIEVTVVDEVDYQILWRSGEAATVTMTATARAAET